MQVRGKCMSVFLSWTDECFKFVAASSNSLLTCIRSIILRAIWTPLKPICWAKGKAGISFCRNKNKRETLKSVRWVQEKMIWLIYPAELKAASVTITIKPEPQSEFFFHPHHSHEELLTSLTVHKKKKETRFTARLTELPHYDPNSPQIRQEVPAWNHWLRLIRWHLKSLISSNRS